MGDRRGELGDATDPTEISPLLLLTRALDECRVVLELLSAGRGGLMKRGFGLSRLARRMVSGAPPSSYAGDHLDVVDLVDDSSVEHVGVFFDSVDRARERWQSSIEHFEQLFVYHGHRERISRLHNELTLAGLFTVLADLQAQSIPVGRRAGCAHVDAVRRRVQACNDAATHVRELMLTLESSADRR